MPRGFDPVEAAASLPLLVMSIPLRRFAFSIGGLLLLVSFGEEVGSIVVFVSSTSRIAHVNEKRSK